MTAHTLYVGTYTQRDSEGIYIYDFNTESGALRQVAVGGADVMTDPVMNLWDRAALVPIIQGAGGRISDWQGGVLIPLLRYLLGASP